MAAFPSSAQFSPRSLPWSLGFVWVLLLAAFVYCMTFLGGWTGLLRPEAFRSIHP
jgi:hypothetical protein